ncbi:MAG TPA: hypothetical protein VE010_01570, partial [Thermoanaerobaculia bacterium]|nr:hypothetical protein [Thermoanaerobaculia bacterium]
QLALDVERHLASLPISAGADSWRYRSGKFVRRNRFAVAGATLLAVSLIAGAVGTFWQAQRAQRRFDEVRSLANTFLFRFHDEIRDLPGSTRARELVASTALEYLDKLSADAENDENLQMELGAASEKVGDVLGNPRNSNLGRTDEARASYEKSLQLRLAASGAEVDRTIEGRAVLQSHLKLADVFLNGGKTDESKPHVDAALALAERYGTPLDRAGAFSRHGEFALRRGDLATAEREHKKAFAQAQQAAAREPGTAANDALVLTSSRLGAVYKMASRQREAVDALDVALQAALRLEAAEPARTTHVRTIMKLRNDRGDVLRSPFAAEGMRPDLSLKEYEDALTRAAWLAQVDPSEYSARVAVVMAKAQIADTWREIDPARSLPLFEPLFADAEQLRRDDPKNFQTQWLAALLRLAYADATRLAGRTADALQRYDIAVAKIEEMRNSDRGRSISRRDIAKALGERGAVRLSLCDVDGASRDAAACQSHVASFVIADARPLDLRDTALCYELAGDVALRRGDPAAVPAFDEALLRWREFGRRNLDSPFLREHRASAEGRRNRALTHAAQRNRPAAR